MTSAPPDVLRASTDRRVLELLYDGPRSRSELAAVGGISKPTASESVRRLESRGLVADTGERRHGTGRTASLVGIRPHAGAGLAVAIEPSGVRASRMTVAGETIDATQVALPVARTPRAVSAALRKAARRIVDAAQAPIRYAAVSAADPVRRSDGRLVDLPDAPFLVGTLDARKVLAAYIEGEVRVDNDVNWAAGAELAARGDAADFGYLHLGTGLGAALVSDGEVRRGHQGFAGEVAHVIVAGPDGRAVPFTEVFAELNLRQHDSTAIDLNLVARALQHSPTSVVLGQALAGVVAAFVAVADPAYVVLSGAWGPAALAPLELAMRDYPRKLRISAAVVNDPVTEGVRTGAVTGLRDWLATTAAG